ncbi:hypothetical protein, variant [Saprolegnia diclina VS20]|uniref:Uncharacterized protein n=1 Tax=Saprolegnia diclina (strain VS20) TaxID=1156394 RepID=T0RG76_SAPDV|nr:hypothetical protein, variant [Saprolegnia diclina VS20]EQC31283.1 hypothetical protein, variant [Saprolegnia diclina VS20]|eukprot:XP_008615124.1 hypothetical protein, variant [Saprolegnia diclina VS20]
MELLDAIRAGSDVSALLGAPNVSLNAQDKDGHTALMLATQANNIGLMQQLLTAACDVNRRNQAGQTALFFASSVVAAAHLVEKKINLNARDAQRSTAALRVIEAGHEDVAVYLIERGCDINERNKAQKTMLSAAIGKSQRRVIEALAARADLDWKAAGTAPLLFAAMTGNVDIASLLLTFNCDMDAPGPDGTTPLMAAIQNGHAALMLHLLENGCNVNCRDKAGRSAWNYALEHDHSLAATLLEHGYDLRRADPNGQTALAVALAHKADVVAKLVVTKMAEQGLNLSAPDPMGKSALWAAVLHGDTELVALLLDEGCSASAAAKDGSTPLSLAIQHQKDDVVRLLLQHDGAGDVALLNAVTAGDVATLDALLGYGVDVNATDRHGNTPLMLALRHRHEAMTTALLAKQCDTERCNDKGESALHMALADENVLALLLETSSGMLNRQDQSGKTLLMTALERHATDAVLQRLLTQSPPASLAATDTMGRNALFCAVETNRVEIAKHLLALGTNPNTQLSTTGETVLMAAVRHEPTLVEPLLERGASVDLPDHDGVTPILAACASSTTPSNVVAVLGKRGCNLNAQAATFHDGKSPLMLALSHAREDVVELLLAAPTTDVTLAATDGRTALFLASTPALIRTLVARGCPVDTKDKLGRTPFMMAFDHSSDDVALALIDLECNVTAVSKEGVSALSQAAASASVAMVQRLLDAGCDINVRDPTQNGNTPLMLALQNNRTETVRLLLERKCDVVRGNKLGQSALFFASVDTVAKLREMGCNVDAKDEDGQSPLMYLLRCNRPDVARLLMDKKCNLLYYNNRGESLLWYVVHVRPETDAIAMATELLSHGVDKNHQDKAGDTALLHVLRHRLRGVAQLLVDREADVTIRNQNESALHLVVDDVDWVERLIKAGCRLNDQTHDKKQTPLMLALESKCLASAKELLTAKGCDLRPADTTGATALFYIIRAQATALLDTLFEREMECDLNAQLHDGYTPLMEAIKFNLPDIAERLLRHRCDVSLLNNERASALHMLEESTSVALQQLRSLLETTDLFFGDTFELHLQQEKADAASVPLSFLPWRKGALETDLTKPDVQYVLVVPGPEMLENNNTRDAFIPARFVIKPRSSDAMAKEKKTVLKYAYEFVLQVAPETCAICVPTSQQLYSLNAKTPGSNHVLSLQPRFRDASAKVLSKGEMHVALTNHRANNPVRNGDDKIVVHVADANRLRKSFNTDWVTLPALTRADGVVARPVCCDIDGGFLGLNGLLDRRQAKPVFFSIHKIDM